MLFFETVHRLRRKCAGFVLLGMMLLVFSTAISCAGPSRRGSWSKGRTLYHAKCRSCHRLISPDKHTDEEWNNLVKKYGEKLNLTEEEQTVILAYLQENN